jgi:hypothetical protein
MTRDDWFSCSDFDSLSAELSAYPDRKLHLLTAALLRRVWDLLPCDHTRFAVDATEKFVDGRISARELAWVRSQASLEAGDGLWLACGFWMDLNLIYCPECSWWEPEEEAYHIRVAKHGGILDGVLQGLDDPAWIAASAVFYARLLEDRAAPPGDSGAAAAWEQRGQFAVVRDILGETSPSAPLAPEWFTSTVLALVRDIHRDQAFDRLPILADALQDAGCDDEGVLTHCREVTGHVRGCWAVDLALGIG